MMNAVKERYQLLSNVAATGSAFTVQRGGKWRFDAKATWGGGTVKLQILGPDNTNYLDVSGASLTADGSVSVDLPCGATVRANVATATAVYSSLSLVG